jgi:outer membrane immunogenic protein
MRQFIVGLALSAFVMPAMAADLAPPVYTPSYAPPIVPVFSWTGCYIGADIGGAMSDQDVSNTSPPVTGQAGASGTIHANNFIGGGYAGCNYQWSSAWVIGIEGDYTGVARTEGGTTFAAAPSPGGSGRIAWTNTLDSIATVRGRVGYAWSPGWLFFATGGGAWGRSSYSSIDVFPFGCPLCGATSFSNTASGYVVGAGMDWAPWQNNWVIRAEYLYYNLSGATGTSVFPGTSAVAANPGWNNMSIQSARIGLSYKFW